MQRFFTTEISDPQFERDHLRFITVRSKNLPGRGDMSIYVPPVKNLRDTPIVILLHGVYGSAWCWPLKTGVHLIADRLIQEKKINPMVLVMPSDGSYRDGSGYLPHKDGFNYEKWISEDVPAAVRQEINITSDSSPLFVTGLSMGGYGALRIGAKNPGRFRAFSGLSSITTFQQLSIWYEDGDISEIEKNVMEKPLVLDIIIQNKLTLPPFIFDCGSSDILIEANRKLHADLDRHNILHQYNEYEGEHNWDYWRQQIARHLLFFNEQLKSGNDNIVS